MHHDCICGGVHKANIEPETEDLFRTIIAEHNQKNGTHIEYQGIESAAQQVVAGFLFDAKVKTNEGLYHIKVWDKPGTQGHEVQAFEKL